MPKQTNPPSAPDPFTAAIDAKAAEVQALDPSRRGRRTWSVYWPAYKHGRGKGLSGAEIFAALVHAENSQLTDDDSRKFLETMRGRWRRAQQTAREKAAQQTTTKEEQKA